MNVWYTNADVLTNDKRLESKNEINTGTPPDIIAVAGIKPKNYARYLENVDYELNGYELR